MIYREKKKHLKKEEGPLKKQKKVFEKKWVIEKTRSPKKRIRKKKNMVHDFFIVIYI